MDQTSDLSPTKNTNAYPKNQAHLPHLCLSTPLHANNVNQDMKPALTLLKSASGSGSSKQ